MTQPYIKIPRPVAIIYRASKGCQQYVFMTVQELATWAARKPYRDEELRVMAMHNNHWLTDERMPAAAAAEFVERTIARARQPEEAATAMASILLGQIERDSAQSALSLVSALSKLAAVRPDMEATEILSIVSGAMPHAAELYTQTVAMKG